MPSLLSTYANAIGVKISKPYTNKKFYPLEFERYITLQPISSNQDSKNYSYWNEVTAVLFPILDQSGIKIVQLGSANESPIHGCIHLMGKTSIAQSNYIISNAIAHIGADSLCQHVAGALSIPIIVPFGATDPQNHGSHWKTPNSKMIESHRWGRKPSYGHENERSINCIPPEKIINAVLDTLSTNIQLNRQSFYFGQRYTNSTIEWSPDAPLHPEFMKGAPILARLDYHFDEQILAQTLSARKLHIISDKSINPGLLQQFKGNIDGLTLEFKKDHSFTPEYIKIVKSLGIKLQTVTCELDGEELSKLRLDFFDQCQIHKFTHKTKDNFISDVKKYLHVREFPLITTPPLFKSNKFILARGKMYISKWHYLNDKPAESFGHNVAQLVDHEEFWKEQDYFYVFSQQV